MCCARKFGPTWRISPLNPEKNVGGPSGPNHSGLKALPQVLLQGRFQKVDADFVSCEYIAIDVVLAARVH